jgi:hypothetical protein
MMDLAYKTSFEAAYKYQRQLVKLTKIIIPSYQNLSGGILPLLRFGTRIARLFRSNILPEQTLERFIKK